jgi:lysophospholipase L1-like esterase
MSLVETQRAVRRHRYFKRLTVLLVYIMAANAGALARESRGAEHWVGTWATAPVARPQNAQSPPGGGAAVAPLNFKDQTLRQIVHISIGGERVRVVLSNAFGTAPLAIGAAHIAIHAKGAAIEPTSDRTLAFSGTATTTILPGAVIFSDPVSLAVPTLTDLAIDIYLPGDTAASPSPLTTHNGARQTNYISQEGNHAGETDLPVQTTTPSWFFLVRVEVTAAEKAGAFVMFGDSITDGYNSTPDANGRWPDDFAKRLTDRSGKLGIGVLNLGIDGNRVLADGLGISALARFDRDVLVQTGVTHVVVLEGINDLGITPPPRPSVADLIAGHLQLVQRAHARGLKVLGATLLPYEGTIFPGYYSSEGDATRQKLNEWIRTSNAYDGVIDFDAVIRDPSHPSRILPQYDSGDHLHPNDAGYQVMADSINLALFKGGK